ncbi:hypothetical protein DEU56DRAFT_885326 [Suillus clintonianus]|uniref:uncharacterized protein n=1 Tax=Suillus clintonianus TaxID=1904413 RepID=UPI001B861E70|nr:uncharacterized protein DEU56DRAFT_885326 [Suillus clintonianus]KAG2141266.1 hypothetical protein DEU56DRAFT_885326 [Suillus clintonianus]
MPMHVQRHEHFYFTFVTFLVEDCLFRVPRDTLEAQSDIFRDLFLLPVDADKAEGDSDTNPIVLEGILKEEFQSLMKVLYPMPFTRLTPSPDGLPATLEEWTGILKLSRMWGFTSIQEFAIQQMEPILATRPLDKVALAQDYGVTEWLVPGLLQLARREEPVGPEDVRKLGLDTALKLADVEDCLFRVPRDMLESQSDVFRDLFLLPVQTGKAEGHSDTNPIVLAGVQKAEFQSLMKVLYPMTFTRLPSQDGLPATLEEWTGILKLSRMWGFTRIQEFAIQKMEPILATRPLDKVAFAQDYGVTEWLVPGLLQLARRGKPVGLEDVQKLGLDTALKLAEVRESATQATVSGERWDSASGRSVKTVGITATGSRGANSCDFTNRIRQVLHL